MAKAGDAGAKKAVALMKKTSLSRQETRELVGTLREAKILGNVGTEQMISREDRRVAAEAETARKEKAKGTAAGWRQERARQEEAKTKGKAGAATSIWATAKISHSAKEGQENVAKGEKAFVSASRAQQQTKPPTEKQKESTAVDMFGGENY